jgi:hypothetical protein
MLEALSDVYYKIENGEVVSQAYLEKFPNAQRDLIEYLVKTEQISTEYAAHLLKDRGEKTPEIYFED